MSNDEECRNSLSNIENINPDEGNRTDRSQYSLNIIEKYQNENRNIEINQYLKEAGGVEGSTELVDATDNGTSEDDSAEQSKRAENSATKLIIKGWNSTISIQGLDNKSSITFKRDRTNRTSVRKKEKQKPYFSCEAKEKPKKRRWKMLTRSLMSRTARGGRGSADERYPKYVLLKNEEEEQRPGSSERDAYPKMVIFDQEKHHLKKSPGKTEFNLKRSFKNKTEPMDFEERKILRQPQSARPQKKSSMQGKARVAPLPAELPKSPQGHVCKEIEGILKDALMLYPRGAPCLDGLPDEFLQPDELFPPDIQTPEEFGSIPARCLPDHVECCRRPPLCVPVYEPQERRRRLCRHSDTQTDEGEAEASRSNPEEPQNKDLDLRKLQFGFLSSFFPSSVVIMKAVNQEELQEKYDGGAAETGAPTKTEEDARKEDNQGLFENLNVPLPDLTLKAKMIPSETKNFEVFSFCSCNSSDASCRSGANPTEEDRTNQVEVGVKSCSLDESEMPDNVSTATALTLKTDRTEADEERGPAELEAEENATLTKIGYKMYDNLTKMSLGNAKEQVHVEKEEEQGATCEKSSCSIILEPSDQGIRISVPENRLNFEIRGGGGSGAMEIGLRRESRSVEDAKKVVRRDEIWHPNGKGRRPPLTSSEETVERDYPKIKLSMGAQKDVLLSVAAPSSPSFTGTGNREAKLTREAKVGTDDLHLAGGGNLVCAFGQANLRNLSPRKKQLLKNLKEKLEFGKEPKEFGKPATAMKLEKMENVGFPGIFLVHQVYPSPRRAEEPSEVSKLKKPLKVEENAGQLREYYCEECLATVRMYEDENPSVRSMVNKFETIIRLESC